MSTNASLPQTSHLGLDELLKLRAAIDTQLEEKRNELLEEAERVGDVIGNDKKRRGRKAKNEQE